MLARMASQLLLFGGEAPRFDHTFSRVKHVDLGNGAWIDHGEGWLQGHGQVFESIAATTQWQRDRRRMYDRWVDVPRLTARFPTHGPGHPLLDEVVTTLSERYGQWLGAVSAAYYRNGDDSVAPHGDRIGRHSKECVIAILALGEPRRFVLKPVGGGRTQSMPFGLGDLLVMGGTCQRTWTHGIPKVRSAGARISIQFRPVAED